MGAKSLENAVARTDGPSWRWSGRTPLLAAVVAVLAALVGACSEDTDDFGAATTTTMQSSTSVPATSTPTTEPAMRDGVRYFDFVFEEIESTTNVVYWPDAPPLEGAPDARTQDLALGIHVPVGDTSTKRPVIMAFETSQTSWVVEHFVRRGYVVVTPEVRGRPSTPDLDSVLRTRQGMVDGAAAVRFLRANAETYGLHPDAIAATGFSGAGIVSLALAWGQTNSPDVTEIDLFGMAMVDLPGGPDFGVHHADQSSAIAAAFPFAAWYPLELIDAGEPPVMMFNGLFDDTYPISAVERICPAAVAVGVPCVLRTFPAGHSIANAPFSTESAMFLIEQMLMPLGLFDIDSVPPTTTTAPPAATAAPTETRRPFDGDLRDPRAVAVGDGGSVYVLFRETIVRLDPDGSSTTITVEGVPDGTVLGERQPTWSISGLIGGPDDTLWVYGSATSDVDDAQFGGEVFEGWGKTRSLAWVARGECDADGCSWTVTTGNDEPGLGSGVAEMAVAPDGTAYAITFDTSETLIHDGSRWRAHSVGASTAYAQDSVRSVTVGADQTLWAIYGQNAALVSMDGEQLVLYDDEGIPDGRVRSVAAATDGTIWVSTHLSASSVWNSSTEAGGIASFDGTTWTRHSVADGLLANEGELTAGPNGVVWAVHDNGYSRFADGAWAAFTTDVPGFGSEIVVDSDDSVWAVSPRGLVSFDGSAQFVYEVVSG